MVAFVSPYMLLELDGLRAVTKTLVLKSESPYIAAPTRNSTICGSSGETRKES